MTFPIFMRKETCDSQSYNHGKQDGFVVSCSPNKCVTRAKTALVCEKWSALNTTMNFRVINSPADKLWNGREVEPFAHGVVLIKRQGKWGVINTSGNIVIDIRYEKICMFTRELLRVKEQGKWGLVDARGAVV